MKKPVNDPCCVCHTSGNSPLFTMRYPYHRYPGTFTLRKCNSCGLIFNSPRIIDEELFKLYGKSYYFHNRSDAEEFRRIAGVYLREDFFTILTDLANYLRILLWKNCGYYSIIGKNIKCPHMLLIVKKIALTYREVIP